MISFFFYCSSSTVMSFFFPEDFSCLCCIRQLVSIAQLQAKDCKNCFNYHGLRVTNSTIFVIGKESYIRLLLDIVVILQLCN